MADFLVKTRGGAEARGKPRVYFTCHPDDFERYFDKIAGDILSLLDCAIYYTADMTAPFENQTRETDLSQMNLFAVPVTFRLLREENRAMREDLAFAKEKNIPILPLMMETGLDEIYQKPENFGERQYLSPYERDATAVRYEEKLEKYLGAVLVSGETAERIRDSFDGYIFLSYRKKDRKHANDLIHLIHKNPKYRDIAVWYDEFLTPGESFQTNIDKAMAESQATVLLVTPNVLEMRGDTPNFVMGIEYPAALASGKPILPAEMQKTDREDLEEGFSEIPECVSPDDPQEFDKRLDETLAAISIADNDSDPEHLYLIGLAYLQGIDVEVNPERGVSMITEAAEMAYLEAMRTLAEMYQKGNHVPLDYQKGCEWREKILRCCEKTFGEEHPDTLVALCNLALAYSDLGKYEKAFELNEKCYEISCRILGEEHPTTLTVLGNLALAYSVLGNYEKALELHERCYEISCRILGEEHPQTLLSLNNLAQAYSSLGEYEKALELHERCYEIRCRVLGEDHPETLPSLNNLAQAYSNLDEYEKAFELNEKCYESCCRILGEEHPDTLTALNNLASAYSRLGEYEKALELHEKCYEIRCRVLGEDHPDTLLSLNNLASAYSNLDEYEKTLELLERCYEISYRILGEDHPETLSSLEMLAGYYRDIEDDENAYLLYGKLSLAYQDKFGEEDERTLEALWQYGLCAANAAAYGVAARVFETLYTTWQVTLGEDHPKTRQAKGNLEYCLEMLED